MSIDLSGIAEQKRKKESERQRQKKKMDLIELSD